MAHIPEYFRLKQAFEALQEIQGENQEQGHEQQPIRASTRALLLQRILNVPRDVGKQVKRLKFRNPMHMHP